MSSLPRRYHDSKYKEKNKWYQSQQKPKLSCHRDIFNIGLVPCIIKVSLVLCFPLLFFYSLSFPKLRLFTPAVGREGIPRERLCSLSFTFTILHLSSKVVKHSWVTYVGSATVCRSQARNGWGLSCNAILSWIYGLQEEEKGLRTCSEFLSYEVSWGQKGPSWVTESKYHNQNTRSRRLNPPFFLINQSHRPETRGTLQSESSSLSFNAVSSVV